MVGAISTAFAYVAGIQSIRLLGTRLASFLGLSEVVFAAIVSWALLGEAIGAVQLLGGLLILGGIVLVRLERRAPAPVGDGARRRPRAGAAGAPTPGASARTAPTRRRLAPCASASSSCPSTTGPRPPGGGAAPRSSASTTRGPTTTSPGAGSPVSAGTRPCRRSRPRRRSRAGSASAPSWHRRTSGIRCRSRRTSRPSTRSPAGGCCSASARAAPDSTPTCSASPSSRPAQRFARFAEFAEALDVLLRFEPPGSGGVSFEGEWYTRVGRPHGRRAVAASADAAAPRRRRAQGAGARDAHRRRLGHDRRRRRRHRGLVAPGRRARAPPRRRVRRRGSRSRDHQPHALARRRGALQPRERRRVRGRRRAAPPSSATPTWSSHWPREHGLYAGDESVLDEVAALPPGAALTRRRRARAPRPSGDSLNPMPAPRSKPLHRLGAAPVPRAGRAAAAHGRRSAPTGPPCCSGCSSWPCSRRSPG